MLGVARVLLEEFLDDDGELGGSVAFAEGELDNLTNVSSERLDPSFLEHPLEDAGFEGKPGGLWCASLHVTSSCPEKCHIFQSLRSAFVLPACALRRSSGALCVHTPAAPQSGSVLTRADAPAACRATGAQWRAFLAEKSAEL